MAQKTAEIITIGDEILYGQTLDTNSQWISIELDNIGIKLLRKTTVADTEKAIINAFAEAEQRADIVLITGGLGPTADDLTKPCLAKYFNTPLVMFDEALEDIKFLFKNRGRDLNSHNIKQAELPQACQMISNKVGTAPGMWFDHHDKIFISMPGVPREMKKMMLDYIIPAFKERFKTDITVHKMIRTCTIGESVLVDKIRTWEKNLPKAIKLAYLPSIGQVKLRLTAVGEEREALQSIIEKEITKLHRLIDKYIYGYDQDEIEEVIGRMLIARKMTIATAESCTGGIIAHKITSVAGSSAYFRGSIIPYHNDLKNKHLSVPNDIFTTVGAVSEACVQHMAINARKMFGADIAVATSGIAGPGGATMEKPVGTIWIAVSTPEKTTTKLLQLGNNRQFNIELTAIHVLNQLRIALKEMK